jgi:DNA-binding NarL/FixJ family response regulator
VHRSFRLAGLTWGQSLIFGHTARWPTLLEGGGEGDFSRVLILISMWGLIVGENIGLIRPGQAEALTQFLETAECSREIGLHASGEAISTITDGFIALIESGTFIRECIRRSMQSAFPLQIQTFSEATELQRNCHKLPKMVLLSAIEDNKESNGNVFKILSQIAPGIPIIVLAYNNDTEMAKAAFCHGAKGYIPVTLGFDIAIEAVRFVLAGGTYVPIDYLLMRTWPSEAPVDGLPVSGAVTARELEVVRAIQRGKSNKVIAYELGMCESTVKVHVRRVMKKLKAKNRTEVAIKTSELLKCSNCTMQRECWSAGYCAQRAG